MKYDEGRFRGQCMNIEPCILRGVFGHGESSKTVAMQEQTIRHGQAMAVRKYDVMSCADVLLHKFLMFCASYVAKFWHAQRAP